MAPVAPAGKTIFKKFLINFIFWGQDINGFAGDQKITN